MVCFGCITTQIACFGLGKDGTYQAGQTSLTAETPLVTRPALSETQLPVPALCAKLRDDSEAALPVTIASIRSLMTGPQRPDKTMLLSPEEVGQFAQAAAERYPRLSPLGRKMLLVGLPPGGMVSGLQPFDDSCRSEADPSVLAIFLATRVRDDKDPVLTAAALSSDPKLGPLAQLLAERLASGANTYARLPLQQARAAPEAPKAPQDGEQQPADAPGGSR